LAFIGYAVGLVLAFFVGFGYTVFIEGKGHSIEKGKDEAQD
jgi:hypothetical protein